MTSGRAAETPTEADDRERSHNQLSPAVAPSLLRTMNQRLLLDRLFRHGPTTRPQLAKYCGLSLPTVIAALSDLESVGLVRATRQPGRSQGRPALLYEADPTVGAIVGIDIGQKWLHVRVSDLAGRRLHHADLRNTRRSTKALIDGLVQAVTDAVAAASIGAGTVIHVVIGSPGVFDPRSRRVVYAANLPGLQRAGVTEALATRLGMNVSIDNDINLAALGEYTYGAARNVNQFAYISIGTGVGLGFVLDGRIYRGHTGSAGEVGYLPIGEPMTTVTKPRAAQRGMLEEALAADAVVRYAQQAGMSDVRTAEDVFDRARQGHQAATQAVEVEARYLARLIASTCAFLDPELIVVGGGVGHNLDLLLPHARSELTRLTPMQPPALAAGVLGTEAIVLGATARGITLARESVFRNRAASAGP